MKQLKELILNIEILDIKGNLDVEISSIAINSSSVIEGSLFIAIKGEKVDGHDFIGEVIGKGVKVIVYENEVKSFEENVTYIKVKDTHDVAGKIATAFYDYPSEKLKLVGVTGTNGKTTITTLSHTLFRNVGYKAGMIGTVVNRINDEEVEAVRTTPDPVTLNKLLKDMVDAGCEYCFMEVSSHAIYLKRISGLCFAGGIFTNLTHDHLDFHKTIEEYAKVKQSFFTNTLTDTSFALSNMDSDYGKFMVENSHAKKYFYQRSLTGVQHLKNQVLDTCIDFSSHVETKLLGDFNQSNVLAVLATSVILGIDENIAREEIKKLNPVPGRFVSFTSPSGVVGIVDYAHTPDALQNVLETVNKLRSTGVGHLMNQVSNTCKIITVVGCGGDRDKMKRPVMAKIGYDMSDILILTSDNPRSENVEDILSDMQAGLPMMESSQGLSLREKVFVISDRHEAIRKACELAKEGDYILVAGKGHENYQEVNGVKTHFDDMEELKKNLN